ncbi:T9SS type A sorting domain-containing protein [Nonlabens tegetincola]|uniref:T9SS type A sorting domain-containing protein n=1 Tax=Nonlabens tegetincola TaxID=323273 RepID=UPI0038B284F8
MEFYPNPSKDYIFIEGNGDVEKSVTISSLSGTLLLQHHEINQNLTKIDISNLATGVYFLTVTSNNDIITWKFIKSQ